MNKSEFVTAVQEQASHLTKNDINAVLDGLNAVVIADLKANGTASIPGLVKFKAVQKAATEERPGINPFTKQAVTIPAKPASTKVKASPLKVLKEAV